MSRRRGLAVVLGGGAVAFAAVGLALLVAGGGCSGGPTAPEVARKIEDDGPVYKLVPPTKPTATDAAAAKRLADAIAAHTGGHPDKLAAFKACAYTRGGQADVGGSMAPLQWSNRLAWPDRYRVRWDVFTTAVVRQEYGLTPTDAWRSPPVPPPATPTGKPEKQKLTAVETENLRQQFHEDCLAFLFPLTEPGTVASLAEGDTIDGKAADGLHVWAPEVGYALCHFDAGTHLLRRFRYLGREVGESVVKDFIVADYQDVSGVKLPAKHRLTANGRVLAAWEKLTVDTAPPADPKVFDGP